ncbi:MAG: hypothetical protein ACREVK_11840 [Gammaproteobacteria bacterium]
MSEESGATAAMRIGLFCHHDDRLTATLHRCLEEIHPGASRIFEFPVQGTPKVVIDRTGVYWDGTDVTGIDVAFVQGIAYACPVIPPNLEDIDWSVWRTDYIGEEQRSSFFYSALCEMERRGVKVINPFSALVQDFMKADLLEDFRQAGFNVPQMICTNDPEEAGAFSPSRTALWRPATGRAAWQPFRDKQREALVSPGKPPVLLAEPIEGTLIRAYALDGHPLLSLEYAPPDAVPVERLELFRAIECPQAHAELERLAAAAGFRWAQVLFVLREDRVWIYDVDASPVFDWLPEVFLKELTLSLAEGLLRREHKRGEFELGQFYPRPMPFLRRMLWDLFSMEYRKYHH